MNTLQDYVSIALIISFSRMCKTLGLPPNTAAGEVAPDVVAQVSDHVIDVATALSLLLQ